MKQRRLAVIMDPIESIKPAKDTTLAMLLEAQQLRWEVFYAQLEDIWLRDGRSFGRLTELRVADDPDGWFERRESDTASLAGMDVILMRKDPPFDMQYIAATYILQRAEEEGTLVINRPQALRDANEKAFLAWFPECAPPTLISRSLAEMRAFVAEHDRVAVKPLDLMGGQSVFVTGASDGNQNVVLETVSGRGGRYAMLQKYLPEIATSGDKRVFLIDGQPIPQALVRIPSGGDHRGNLVTGARTEIQPLTARDQWICERMGPALRDRGLTFVGIDIIGDFVTEINVTSATGVRELERATDQHIMQRLFEVISAKLAN